MSIYEEFENGFDENNDIQDVEEGTGDNNTEEVKEGAVIDAMDPEALFEAEADLYIESAAEVEEGADTTDTEDNDSWD